MFHGISFLACPINNLIFFNSTSCSIICEFTATSKNVEQYNYLKVMFTIYMKCN